MVFWELMHYKDGWLERALCHGSAGLRAAWRRHQRPRGPWSASCARDWQPGGEGPKESGFRREYGRAASPRRLTAMAEETDGLLDFRRERDAFIDQTARAARCEFARHGNYDIVHFAGHAAFDAKNLPAVSAWLLSDGRLSARAIGIRCGGATRNRGSSMRAPAKPAWTVVIRRRSTRATSSGWPARSRSRRQRLHRAALANRRSGRLGNRGGVLPAAAERAADDRRGASVRQSAGESKTFDTPSNELAGDGSEPRNKKVSWRGCGIRQLTATFGQRIGAPAPRN